MEITPRSQQNCQVEAQGDLAGPPRCPLCGGLLAELPAHYRCGQCGYGLCISCEPCDFGPSAEAT